MVLGDNVDAGVELVCEEEEETRFWAKQVHLRDVLVDQFSVVHRRVDVLAPSNLLSKHFERVQCVNNIFAVKVFAIAPFDAFTAMMMSSVKSSL